MLRDRLEEQNSQNFKIGEELRKTKQLNQYYPREMADIIYDEDEEKGSDDSATS